MQAQLIDDKVMTYIISQLAPVKQLVNTCAPLIPFQLLAQLTHIEQIEGGSEMIRMAGYTADFLQNERNKMEKRQSLLTQSSSEKSQIDRQLWSLWIVNYRHRLLLEVDGMKLEEIQEIGTTRIQLMNANNPKFVLRNWIAQVCIQKAEKGDFSKLEEVCSLLKNPYADTTEFVDGHYDSAPPDWAADLCITCSS